MFGEPAASRCPELAKRRSERIACAGPPGYRAREMGALPANLRPQVTIDATLRPGRAHPGSGLMSIDASA